MYVLWMGMSPSERNEGMARGTKEPSFEQNLEQLEAIIHGLEQDDLQLEDMLKNYESGMQLIEKMESRLNQAAAQLKILGEDEGKRA